MSFVAQRVAFEYKNSKSVTKILKEYLKNHPNTNPTYQTSNLNERGQSEIPKSYSGDPVQIEIRKYGKSNFRHKDRPSGIVKDFNIVPENPNIGAQQIPIPEVKVLP